MKSIPWLAFCVLAGSVLYGAVHAQSVPPPERSVPSLASAVEAAWQRAVQAREAEGQLARAKAGQYAANSLWAAPPSLEFSHYDDRLQNSAGRRESEVGLAWPLWLPGQRSARSNVAQADLRVAEVAQRAAKLRIAGEVREAVWAVSAREAELSVAEAQVRSLQALTDDVERRVAAGDLARADALAVRGELLAATGTLTEARQRLQVAWSRWRVLTGVEPISSPVEAYLDGDATEQPELALATLRIERAHGQIDLTRVSRRDPPELTVSYRQDAPGSGIAVQNSIGVAIRIPFGTDDRNLPRETAALTELDVAQAEERRLRERVEVEIDTARAAVLASETQLLAEQSRLALLRERAQLIDKSFRAGETPLPELLRALAAAAQAKGGVARQQAELGLSRARLQQSLGILP